MKFGNFDDGTGYDFNGRCVHFGDWPIAVGGSGGSIVIAIVAINGAWRSGDFTLIDRLLLVIANVLPWAIGGAADCRQGQ